MQPDSALLARVERLERQNRTLRRASLAIACGGLLLGLAGMAAPALCDTIYAERLVLRDNAGHQRIVADAYSGTPSISVLSREGRAAARIGIGSDGEPFLAFFDEKGAAAGTWKGALPERPAPRTDAERSAESDRTVSALR